MMDAHVEDYFRYDELAQMESEAIRHNITGSDTEVLEKFYLYYYGSSYCGRLV
jgi:hypothetical protein